MDFDLKKLLGEGGGGGGHGGGGNQDLEGDADLLAELAALQHGNVFDRRASGVVNVAPTPAAAPPKRPAPAPTKPPPKREGHLDPSELARALAADRPLPEADETTEIQDSGLDDELAALMGGMPTLPGSGEGGGGGTGPPTREAPPVPQRGGATTTAGEGGQASHLRALGDYYAGLHATAAAKGEAARANRYKRSLDRCRELEKKAARGVKVDESEIPEAPPNFSATNTSAAGGGTAGGSDKSSSATPPPLPARKASTASTASGASQAPPPPVARDLPPPSTATPPPVPQRQSAQIPPPEASGSAASEGEEDPKAAKREQIRSLLQRRRELYVKRGKEAVAAKDKAAAIEAVTASKQFDEALAALPSIDPDDIDPSDIPPSPPPYRPPAPTPRTFIEHLEARRDRFVAKAEECRASGDERRQRMNMRQVGQFVDAIKEAKAGRPVDVSSLPSLPDMPPLPPQGGGGGQRPAAVPSAGGGGGPTPQPRVTAEQIAARVKPPPSIGPLAPSGVPGQSRASSQLDFLLERQRLFKQAALAAKNVGNMELAKKYLVDAKGFDKMIAASRGGLPVDISGAPIPPQALTSQRALEPRIEHAAPAGRSASPAAHGGGGGHAVPSGERLEVLGTLEKALIGQIQTAENNRLRFTRLGDVGKVRQFEEWAKAAKNDLVLIREVARQGLKVPPFHYEQRSIPSADLFPDLAEDALELTVVGATDVPLPAGYEAEHANLFVRWTFPYPTEAAQTGKTKYVAGSRSPNWSEEAVVQIGSRKARGQKLTRILKRLPLKLELYQKGGFLRSDKIIGVGEVKLDVLEGKAEHEESVPLKDGRKAIGGLISVRVRVREPLGDAKVAQRTEKWLIIDA